MPFTWAVTSLKSHVLLDVLMKQKTETDITVKMSALSVYFKTMNMVEYLCNDTERTMIGVGSTIHVSIHVKMCVDYQRLSLASEHHTLTSETTSAAFLCPASEMQTSDRCVLVRKADSRAQTNTGGKSLLRDGSPEA